MVLASFTPEKNAKTITPKRRISILASGNNYITSIYMNLRMFWLIFPSFKNIYN